MKKRMIALVLSLCLITTLLPVTAFAANSVPFKDVVSGSWYYDAVAYVYEKGLMNGTSNSTFQPDATLTRAQICQILYNMEGTPSTSSDSFTDVGRSAWYYRAVNWAADHSIVSGVGSGKFQPEVTVTREQMMTIMYRYAGYKDYDVSDIVDLSEYTDADAISDWAKTAMKWAVSEGFITGMTATTIAPTGTATRSQAAAILMRFCTKIEALQAFQEKNIEDFKGYEIINFDESDETNFAVLAEDTTVSETTKENNRLISSDEENGVFVFSNINEQIAGLTTGDVLYITYGDGEEDYLLLKVGSIEVKGDTATITEGEAELSDYFEYIDVDMEVGVNADDFDPSSADSDVTYEGTSEDAGTSRLFSTLSRSVGGDASTEFKFGVNNGTISATASVKLTLNVKIKYDKSIFDIEEIKITVKQENSIEGKLTASATGKEDTYKKSLGKATVPIFAGLDAEIEVYIVFDLDLSASVTLKVKTTEEKGFKYSNGTTNSIDESDSELSLNASGKLNASLGIGMDIGVKALKVMKISFEAEGGLELDAKTDFIGISSDRTERHECFLCIDGATNIYGKLAYKTKLGFTEKHSLTIVDSKLVEVKIHLADFYVSFLNGDTDADAEFGWGNCPHKQYLVTVRVHDSNDQPVSTARVEVVDSDGMIVDAGNVNANGIFEFYCDNDSYSIHAFGMDGYSNVQKELSINGKAAQIDLLADPDEEPDDSEPTNPDPGLAQVTGTLSLSDFSYEYTDGGHITETNDGAIGGLRLSFTVDGPAGVGAVLIGTWSDSGFYTPKKINDDISMMTSIWAGEITVQPRELPFRVGGTSFPVYPKDRGTIKDVLLIGVDEQIQAMGYAIVTVEIP